MKPYRLILSLLCIGMLFPQCAGKEGLRNLPEEKKKALLVEDFTNGSIDGSRYDPWKLGLPSMLTDDLVHSGMFRVISVRERLKALDELALQQSGITEARSLELGKLLGAEWIMSGDYQIYEGQLSINVRVVDVGSARVIASSRRQGKVTDFFQISKEASAGLLEQFHLDLTSHEIASLQTQVETHSVEASLENYSGEQILNQIEALKIRKIDKSSLPGEREARIAELQKLARQKFQSALDVDPHYEKSKANLNQLQYPLRGSR